MALQLGATSLPLHAFRCSPRASAFSNLPQDWFQPCHNRLAANEYGNPPGWVISSTLTSTRGMWLDVILEDIPWSHMGSSST